MTRYLVTGANGFVGRCLCQGLLERGLGVRALLRRDSDGPWSERVIADLGRGELPAGLCDGVAGVFHLAGIAHVADISAIPAREYQRVNVEGTRALLAASHAAGVGRLVYLSSVKAVADPGRDCVDEAWDAPPTDAYGRSKREAEGLVLAAAHDLGLHACVLRPTLVYGPGVKGNLRRMIDAVAAGRFPPLPEVGNRRSLVSVQDLCEAAWLAMQDARAAGRLYLVADGIDYSTRGLYLAIRAALGRPAPAWTIPGPVLRVGAAVGDRLGALLGRPMPLSSAVLERLQGSACYRAERLRAELGWQPRQSFYDQVAGMLAD